MFFLCKVVEQKDKIQSLSISGNLVKSPILISQGGIN